MRADAEALVAAVMQPYFLPYIGYFQLLSAADVFVAYDTIKYTKRGWINRNRFLRNGGPAPFTIPLRGAPDLLDIRDRWIAAEFDGQHMLRQLDAAYRRAPNHGQVMGLLERILLLDERNLYQFIESSIAEVSAYIQIDTPIRRSSEFQVDGALRSADRVIAICHAVGASHYVNSIGGIALYDRADFAAAGIDLSFLRSHPLTYQQFGAPFVPDLSIVDVLMFNDLDRVRSVIRFGFDLVRGES